MRRCCGYKGGSGGASWGKHNLFFTTCQVCGFSNTLYGARVLSCYQYDIVICGERDWRNSFRVYFRLTCMAGFNASMRSLLASMHLSINNAGRMAVLSLVYVLRSTCKRPRLVCRPSLGDRPSCVEHFMSILGSILPGMVVNYRKWRLVRH